MKARVAGVVLAVVTAAAPALWGGEQEGKASPMSRVRPLADAFVKVFESPDPKSVYTYSPGLARCPNGRLVATTDLGGPGVGRLPGPKGKRGNRFWKGKLFTSDDHGKTWTHRTDYPFLHARPFVAGKSLYVLGHAGDLRIIRSDDWGETWGEPVRFTEGQDWHQAPCNVLYANGCVYLVMERWMYHDVRGWGVNQCAPVLMRGRVGDDLTKKGTWTFASEMAFRDAVPTKELDYFGVPFYKAHPQNGVMVARGRHCAPMGWLETNVVQFVDRDHIWHDPKGKTFYLWMRAHTGGTGLAAVAKVVEHEDGSMTTGLATVPSGRRVVYVPCPGGQMKFHILYDDVTKLYWLLSSQATDSMTRPDRLPSERYNLPNNERHRLQLHFSKNCIDWCFAGIVAMGPSPKQSRHYASMVIDGEDLHVLSRSGDARARSAHDGDFISFHTVKGFRGLVY